MAKAELCGDENVDQSLDNIFSEASNRRGRPMEIADPVLFSVRSRLIGLLEDTWCDVGLGFQRIRIDEITDMPKAVRTLQNAFRSWEAHRDCIVVDLLLRPSRFETDPKELRSIRRRLVKLQNAIPDILERQTRSREALDEVERALAEQTKADQVLSDRNQEDQTLLGQAKAKKWPQEQGRLIMKERRLRVESVEAIHAEYLTTQAEISLFKNALLDGNAYFAWAQLVDFCTDPRYSLTPLNLASALAGVPFLKWRRSLARCLPWKLEDFGGGPYAVFSTIHLILKSCPPKGDLVTHAEEWLQTRRGPNSRAVEELGRSWHFLRSGIEEMLKGRHFTNELAFRIAAEYARRKKVPTGADRLLASISQIRAKIKKRNK